ncbi:MAG: L-aspartate oxidase [Rickettsiales bacterium]|nr:L-aspartate oxidase [Rickettsiales bacterium]
MAKITTDILILGAGIAGLTAAIKIAEKFPEKKILILNKTTGGESNSKYAQGGIAAVWDNENDNFEKHILDTKIAGDGLCDEEIVRIVVEECPERIKEIISWQANFDKDEKNKNFKLTKEGGHSERRILHFKDMTGFEILRALTAKANQYKNIEILENYFALDFITQHHLGYNVIRVTPEIECYGCYALNKINSQIDAILSKATICCTGGVGQVYKITTNPEIATGDGIAMVYRAKGRVCDMEFVQFHPTALYNKNENGSSFLISEAVRGEGAVLKNHLGQEFMHLYDSRLSLAPRDVIARAIDSEMKKYGTDFVYLDATKIAEKFSSQFPNILAKCLEFGVDPRKDLIPVGPACHYLCGGIKVDEYGRTSIKYLYAAGECAATGLHGANRLASNSLSECLVFAERIFQDISKNINSLTIKNEIPDWQDEGTKTPSEMVLITQAIRELKEIMTYYVGIVRSNLRLKKALDRIDLLYQETEELYKSAKISPQLMELRNLITIAYLITRSASLRKESRGLNFNTDYPNKLEFIEHTIL